MICHTLANQKGERQCSTHVSFLVSVHPCALIRPYAAVGDIMPPKQEAIYRVEL